MHSYRIDKHGRSYTVQTDKDVLVTEMREMGGDDAQSQLDLFQEVLNEVGENLGKWGNGFGKKKFSNIKNLSQTDV